jgi:hypothetical protein
MKFFYSMITLGSDTVDQLVIGLRYVIKINVICFQEHKKILYFYPQGVTLDSQITQIGLCEAIIKFTQ